LCPVETNPPNPNCLPTAETYAAYPIGVWNSDKSVKIASLSPNLEGNYKLELPAGSYVVDFEKPAPFSKGVLPATVAIQAGQTSVFNISVDTGIR